MDSTRRGRTFYTDEEPIAQEPLRTCQREVFPCGASLPARGETMCAMPRHLDWIKLYRAAVHEADPDKQPARIEEAKNAMKQALRMAVEYEDSDQRHAISEALHHLGKLRKAIE